MAPRLPSGLEPIAPAQEHPSCGSGDGWEVKASGLPASWAGAINDHFRDGTKMIHAEGWQSGQMRRP